MRVHPQTVIGIVYTGERDRVQKEIMCYTLNKQSQSCGKSRKQSMVKGGGEHSLFLFIKMKCPNEIL